MKFYIGFGLAIAAYLLSFFHRVAPAAIAADLQAAFAIDAVSLGSLAATYFYVYTVMQIPVGVLADTLGPRRILFIGGLAASAGSLLFALAPDFSTAFAGRTLVGFGVSSAFIAMLKIISMGFDERRFATMTGLCMLIGNLGSVLAGAPLAWAAQAFSWRQVFVGIGLVSLLVALLSRHFVADVAKQPASRSAWMPALWQVLANRATWPGFFANVGLAGAFFAFGGLWAVPYFTHVQGMSRAVASNHTSICFVGFALGAALWGRVSDRVGRRKPVMLVISGLNVACWGVWLMASPLPLAATYPLCLAMGLSSAGFTLTWAAAKEVNPPLLSGMATSVVNVGVFLGAAVLQPLVGWCIERTWDGTMENGIRVYPAAAYGEGMALLAFAACAGWLALFLVRETGCRNVWRRDEP
jgi:predicted MFS family arabinose efflux permease